MHLIISAKPSVIPLKIPHIFLLTEGHFGRQGARRPFGRSGRRRWHRLYWCGPSWLAAWGPREPPRTSSVRMVLNAVRRVPDGIEHRCSAVKIGFELLAHFVDVGSNERAYPPSVDAIAVTLGGIGAYLCCAVSDRVGNEGMGHTGKRRGCLWHTPRHTRHARQPLRRARLSPFG